MTTTSSQGTDGLRIRLTLNEENWPAWSFAMESMLRNPKNRLWDFVGAPKVPSDYDKESGEEKRLRAMDAVTKNLEANMINVILDHQGDPRAAWTALKQNATGCTGQDAALIEMELQTKRFPENATVVEAKEYFREVVQLNRTLRSLDPESAKKDSELAMHVLLSLPKSMEYIRYHFLRSDKTARTTEAIQRDVLGALQRDQAQSGNNDIDGLALQTNNSNRKFRGKCHYCKKIGHRISECRTKQNKDKSKKKQNDSNEQKESANVTIALLTALSTATGPVKTGPKDFVMDSAAQCGHVVINRDTFIEYTPAGKTASVAGYGQKNEDEMVKVEGYGTAKLKLAGGQELLLKNAKHVPKGTANLFSTQKAVSVLFKNGQKDAIYSHDNRSSKIVAGGQTILTGSKHGGLFYLDLDKTQDF